MSAKQNTRPKEIYCGALHACSGSVLRHFNGRTARETFDVALSLFHVEAATARSKEVSNAPGTSSVAAAQTTIPEERSNSRSNMGEAQMAATAGPRKVDILAKSPGPSDSSPG